MSAPSIYLEDTLEFKRKLMPLEQVGILRRLNGRGEVPFFEFGQKRYLYAHIIHGREGGLKKETPVYRGGGALILFGTKEYEPFERDVLMNVYDGMDGGCIIQFERIDKKPDI